MLPESKHFPIDFVVAEPGQTARLTRNSLADLEPDAIARLGQKFGWKVTSAEGRWSVELEKGGAVRMVRAERTGGAGGGILRFMRVDAAAPKLEDFPELLRANARLAHAGHGIGVPGDPSRLVVTATLLEETADDDEIVAAVEAVACGGEAIGSGRIDSFDRRGYKIAPPSDAAGSWEDEILLRSLGGTGIAFQRNGPRAEILVRLDGGRSQKVHLFFDRVDSSGRQLVQMISICGSPGPEHFRMALGSNPTLAFATIGLAKIGQAEELVVLRTQLAHTADPEEILMGVSTLARIGDRLEHELTGGGDVR